MRRSLWSTLWLLSALLLFVAGCGGGDQPAADSGNSADSTSGGDSAAQNTDGDQKPIAKNTDGTSPGVQENKGNTQTGATPAADGLKSPLSYVTDGFFAAMVVNPRRAVESKLVAKMIRPSPGLQLPEQLQEQLAGLETAKQVEQVIVLFGPVEGKAMHPMMGHPLLEVPLPEASPAVIVRFKSPDLLQQMLASMPPSGEELEHNGKKYYRQFFMGGGETRVREEDGGELPREFDGPDDPTISKKPAVPQEIVPGDEGPALEPEFHGTDDPSLPNARYTPDDRTIIFAREGALKKMMDATEVKSPLVDRLKAAGPDHDLVVVLLGDGLREPLREFAGKIPPQAMSPQVQDFVKMIDDINVITITAGADSDPIVKIEVETTGADAAQFVQEKVNPFLKMGQGFLGLALSANEQPASVQPIMAAVGDIVNGANLTQSDAKVVFTVPRPASLDKVDTWLQAAVETRQQQTRANNLREIGNALLYSLDEGALAGNIYSEVGDTPLLSWRVATLPQIGFEGIEVYEKFDVQQPWDSEHNQPLLEVKTAFEEFVYTSAPGVKPGHTVYLAFQGAGAMIDGKKRWKDTDLKDGISGTVAVIEVSPERAVPWTKPVDIDLSAPDVMTMLGPPPTKAGYPAVMFDGRVITLPADIDIETLRKLAGFDNGVPPGYEPEF